MSREIPQDRPLSDEDREYLHARGQHSTVARLDELFPAGNDADAEESLGGQEVPTGDDGDDYDDWKVAELQAELGKRDLSKSGTKDELIARLREDDKQQS